jgi:two-component system cell cycle response regulator
MMPAPSSPAPPQARSSAKPADSDISIDGTRVLLVDDNEQNLELMQAYLESLPCKIELARDGVEAVAKIERNPPDLVLLDVMMPRMSGFEVCQKIKSNPRTHGVQVIMVTALHEVGDVERAHEAGTNDFISKPVNKLELLTRVRSLLKFRVIQREFEQIASLTSRIGPDTMARLRAGEKLE